MGTAVLILAAGASQRMGFPKQLLSWNDTTLLRDTVDKIVSLDCDETIVVLGASYETIEPTISDTPVTVLHHTEWQKGMGSTISLGIQFILKNLPNIERVLITLSDLPLVDANHYHRLLTSGEVSEVGIVASKFDSIIGVPAVFGKDYFSELIQLADDKGAKSIIKASSSDCTTVISEVPYLDVDTPEAYERLLQMRDSEKDNPS